MAFEGNGESAFGWILRFSLRGGGNKEAVASRHTPIERLPPAEFQWKGTENQLLGGFSVLFSYDGGGGVPPLADRPPDNRNFCWKEPKRQVNPQGNHCSQKYFPKGQNTFCILQETSYFEDSKDAMLPALSVSQELNPTSKQIAKMKYSRFTPLFFAFLIAISACRSFEPALLKPQGEPFASKLPTLKPIVENNLVAIVSVDGATVLGANPNDIISYFENEVQEIMTQPYGEIQGIAKLKVENYEQKLRLPGLIFVWCLYIPSLFGFPMYTATSSVGVEIEIATNSGRIIGQYKGDAIHKEVCALNRTPKSFKARSLLRVAYLLSVKDALQEAKAKMLADIPRLKAELSK